MKNIRKRHAEEVWENGELGASESHVRKVSKGREYSNLDAILGTPR